MIYSQTLLVIVEINEDNRTQWPPPFLQGVYVRDSFDFDRCGSALSALSEVPAIAKPDVPPADGSAPPQLSAMMSDDDFLNWILQ